MLVKFISRVPVQQARQIANSRRPSTSNYLPFRLVYGGVVPVSAAIGSLALARITQEFVEVYILGTGVAGSTALGGWTVLGGWTAPQNGWSWLVFALLITAFTYLSNFALIWGGTSGEGPSLAEELKYRGTFIPGVRPGQRTAHYLSKLMLKISAAGSLILCVLAVALPWLVFYLTGQDLTVTFLSLFVVIEHLDRFWDHLKADYLQESYSSLL